MINNFIHYVKIIGYKTGDAVSSGISKTTIYAGKKWREIKVIKCEIFETIKKTLHSTKHTSDATPKEPLDANWIESKLPDSWTSSAVYSAASKAEDVSQTTLLNTAETGELPVHMGFAKEGNGNQAKFESLVAYYSSHPREASQALKSSRKALAEFKVQLQDHYTQRNITLLGRDALNRMLLTDSKFSTWIEDPKVLRGLASLAALGNQVPPSKEAKALDALDAGESMSRAFGAAVKIHPSSLSAIPPNAHRKDPDYLNQDFTRRENLKKFQGALEQALPEGLPVSVPPGTSRWNLGYDKDGWKGALHEEFSQMCRSLKTKTKDEFKKFVDPNHTRPDLKTWVEEPDGSLGRGIQECQAGLNLLLSGALPEGIKRESLTREEMIRLLANSSIWQEPQVCHFCLDRLHFGGTLMFGDAIQIQLADGPVSGADIFMGVADYLNQSGITEQNGIAGEALFARLAIVTDTGILKSSVSSGQGGS